MKAKRMVAFICAMTMASSIMSGNVLMTSAANSEDISILTDTAETISTLDEFNSALSAGGSYVLGGNVDLVNSGVISSVSIDGAGNSLNCASGGAGAILYQNNEVVSEFRNIVFNGGAKGDVGIWLGAGSMTISNSTVKDFNIGSGRQAAIALGGGNLTLNDVMFDNNSNYDLCLAGGTVNLEGTTALSKMKMQSNNCTLNIGEDWVGSFEITIDAPQERMLGTIGLNADVSGITVSNEGYSVVNKNGLLRIVAEEEVGEDAYIPTLTVDMTNEGHSIIHGSAGFLYGISNEGVPNVNTLSPLKPKVLATKGALGTEHPYGDALDVAEEFFEAGGEQVMMYNSNYYGVFGVSAAAEDFAEVLSTIIAPHVAEWKDNMREKYPDIDSRIFYIPINEGSPIVLADGTVDFNASWKLYYDAIVEGERTYYETHGKYDPSTYEKTAYFAGPNDAGSRNYPYMYSFIEFCKNNDCMPDVVTWHELDEPDLYTMANSAAVYRQVCADLGLEPKQVVINEYAEMKDCGVPGRLVNWISRLEDNELYGCLPFWHQANNLNDLAADDNNGNGAWWVYKWYGDMSGMTLKVDTNTEFNLLYGCATIDDAKRSASVLAGGIDGDAKIVLENISETDTFNGADKVHVKVEAAYFSGYHGAVIEPATVLEGTYAVEDGKVEIGLTDMLFSTAYNVTVTEASDEVSIPVNGAWRAEYEAEDAEFIGGASNERMSDLSITYYLSGKSRVKDINTEGSGVKYTIDVPVDGRYKLEFLYGNGVGIDRGNVNHSPKNLSMNISIDDGENETLLMPNTLFYGMEGISEKYVDLTAGKHTITLTYDGKDKEYYPNEAIDPQLYQDALYVTYSGVMGAKRTINRKYEAETADFNRLGETTQTNVSTQTDLEGYSGNGYVTGLKLSPVENGGGIRWIVVVEESGIYNLDFKYLAAGAGELNIYKDNTNLTYNNLLTSVSLGDTSGEWGDAVASVYLMKGINLIDIDTDIDAAIDYMRLTKPQIDTSITIEAEDSAGSFTTVYSPYADATYVEGIVADSDEASREENGRYLEFKVDAPSAGKYNMQVFLSNNDMCGTHMYNIKIIDRYAVISVNGGEGVRYFFANTFSDDTIRERTVPVELNEGENTIRIYNDDSWEVLYGGSQSQPGTDRLENYTPNFDKFVFTKAVMEDTVTEDREYTADIKTTKGGYVTADKNTVSEGDSITFTIIPETSVGGVSAGLNGFFVNGEEIGVTENGDGTYSYTIDNVGNDITVTADFEVEVLLNDIVEEAKERLAVEYCYTSASADAVASALRNAEAVAAQTTDATKVYNAYKKLRDAYDALEVRKTQTTKENLVGLWKFEGNLMSDETEITTVANDLSEGGEAVYSKYSYSNQGLALDGSYGLKIGEVGSEFTVSTWAKIENSGGVVDVFFKNMGNASVQDWVGICCTHGYPKIWTHNNSEFRWKDVTKATSWTTGEWTFYTYSEKDGIGTLYINGEKVGSGKVSGADSAQLYLGATFWSGDVLKGTVDNLYLFDKQLNDYEVASLCEGTSPSYTHVNKNALVDVILEASYIDTELISESQAVLIDSAMASAAEVYKNSEASDEDVAESIKVLRNAMDSSEEIEWTEVSVSGKYAQTVKVYKAYVNDTVCIKVSGTDNIKVYSATYTSDSRLTDVESVTGTVQNNEKVFTVPKTENQRIFIWDNEMTPITESI